MKNLNTYILESKESYSFEEFCQDLDKMFKNELEAPGRKCIKSNFTYEKLTDKDIKYEYNSEKYDEYGLDYRFTAEFIFDTSNHLEVDVIAIKDFKNSEFYDQFDYLSDKDKNIFMIQFSSRDLSSGSSGDTDLEKVIKRKEPKVKIKAYDGFERGGGDEYYSYIYKPSKNMPEYIKIAMLEFMESEIASYVKKYKSWDDDDVKIPY